MPDVAYQVIADNLMIASGLASQIHMLLRYPYDHAPEIGGVPLDDVVRLVHSLETAILKAQHELRSRQ